MVILISTHHVKPGMIERAARRIDANGDLMAGSAGFLFRYRVVSRDDPMKLTTVTGWVDEASLEAYNEARKSVDLGPEFAGESPYERIVQEVHAVQREQVGQSVQ